MRHLLSLLLILVFGGSVFGISGSVILVSDNAADAAVADTVKEAEGTNVTVIKTKWGEFDANVVSQVKSAASADAGIVVVGGPAAVLADYEELLADYNITRVAGETRKETAAAVLKHFKAKFRGKKMVLAFGGDEEGIQEALKRAKANKGAVLFVDQEEVPEEVEEALTEANASEVDAVLSPNVNETRIRGRIENRTRAKIKEVVKGNASERADRMIQKATQKIEEMDRALAEINVTKESIARLSEGARAKLDDAKKAYNEGNYGRAFGHAVAANSIAENVLRMAKKLHSFEDRGTAREVKGKIVARYRNLLSTTLRLEKVIALEKVEVPEDSRNLLSEAREHLKLARQALEAEEFGLAVVHMDKAEHAIARLKVALIKRNVDEKRIIRSLARVTEEEVSGEEERDLGKRR